MDILHDNFLRIFAPFTALTLMGEDMLERILEDPSQPLLEQSKQGYGIETIATYDSKTSFLDLCRQGQAIGARRMDVCYDFFFGGDKRENYPDSPKTVKAYKVIHNLLKEYGMQMGASVVSPLDIGGEYVKTHEKKGQTLQFKEGMIRPDGTYSITMDLQTQWTNNKGPAKVTFRELKVFGFDEERIGRTAFYYVNENEILDISASAQYRIDPDSLRVSKEGYGNGDIHISGKTDCGKSRFLAVLVYDTLEIDYFADDALPYMKSILDLHKKTGITYAGIYSDEMHIQFDWDMAAHWGQTEVTTRYMTDSMAKVYAEKFGAQYRDFAKYLVYFTYMHHDFLKEDEAELPAQHVLGKSKEDVIRTFELRKNYSELLHRRVVDLCRDAKAYAEEIFGQPMQATGHSTWQESPTADTFFIPKAGDDPDMERCRYDYTPEYVWSAAQRENISACNDHFKWNEYFYAVGTDIPEGGFLDRNYYGAAFTSGLALLNPAKMAYYCVWGAPDQVKERLCEVGQTYGHYTGYCKSYDIGHNLLQGATCRISDVLTLCPMDLNHLEERFGNWMVQYGYTDYITEEKLLAYAKPNGPILQVLDRTYRALVVQFSPLMSVEALEWIRSYVQQGGTVVWCSAPALREEDGAARLWREVFGIGAYGFNIYGHPAKDKAIRFPGFRQVEDMQILSDLFPDLVYPVTPAAAAAVATLGNAVVGTRLDSPCGGKAVYLGFRVRDDQSCSTGRDVDTLFSLLQELGCYEAGGCEASSRPAAQRYIHNRFPNGTVSLANHCRSIRERAWSGGFYRDEEKDNAFMEQVVLPPHDIILENARLCGHTVRYRGEGIVTYRYTPGEGLSAFAGRNTCGICIDGKEYTLSQQPVNMAWGKLEKHILAPSIQSAYLLKCDQEAQLRLPFDATGMKLVLCKNYVLETDAEYPFTVVGNETLVQIAPDAAGQFMAFYQLA